MAYFSAEEMRGRGSRILYQQERLGKTARTILAEATAFNAEKTYDVFLSHSSRDRALVLGVKSRLEEETLSVCVDWLDDADLDRTAVTPDNADRLRKRMKRCLSLLYLATGNASSSKWMPWEVGYFDGSGRGRIGILPVLNDPHGSFKGMEFLGLYPVVDVRMTKGGYEALFASNPSGEVVNFKRSLAELR
jgi:hypothetical protein